LRISKFLIKEAIVTLTATIGHVAGTRGKGEGGRDHGLVIFASAVLAVLGFPSLPDGVAALRAYGSRPNLATTQRRLAGWTRAWRIAEPRWTRKR
jgi:hypothetical protein